MLTDTVKLGAAMLRAKLSQRALAKLLNISEMAFYNKKNNISEFKVSEVHLLSEALDLSEAERTAIFFSGKVIKNQQN